VLFRSVDILGVVENTIACFPGPGPGLSEGSWPLAMAVSRVMARARRRVLLWRWNRRLNLGRRQRGVPSLLQPSGRASLGLQSLLFQALYFSLSFLKRSSLSTCHAGSFHGPVRVGMRLDASCREPALPAGFTR